MSIKRLMQDAAKETPNVSLDDQGEQSSLSTKEREALESAREIIIPPPEEAERALGRGLWDETIEKARAFDDIAQAALAAREALERIARIPPRHKDTGFLDDCPVCIARAALAAREEPQGHLAEECCPDECPACADETACYVGRTSSDDLADLQACAEEVRDVLVRDPERPEREPAREEPPKPGYWPGTADREETGSIGDGTPHARMRWFWERMRPHEKLIGELTGWSPVSGTYRFEAAIADAFDKLATREEPRDDEE